MSNYSNVGLCVRYSVDIQRENIFGQVDLKGIACLSL